MYRWGLVLSALCLVLLWLYRQRGRGSRLSAHPDAVARARETYEQARQSAVPDASPLIGVDEPALGAAILLVGLVRLGGPFTQRDETEIVRLLCRVTGVRDCEERLSYAHRAFDAGLDISSVINGLSKMWRDQLTVRERKELYGMAKRVCSHRSMASAEQTDAVNQLRRSLLLKW
ncbi:hypothetical protein [uncultured Cohaesibacter sp.]|uniref:hypothetical protein n=1 Tax=uncultured Cohaesibacter sp. TaxID=1002546 RepID=UPI00292E7752|nr:hypothetical protein [uncultured Cohaesibacter sp.]